MINAAELPANSTSLVPSPPLSAWVSEDGDGVNENNQRTMIGRVTSTYHSPTLGKGIAMGLVLNGPDRMGEVLDFPGTDGKTYQAKIVDPIFYDKEGAKQNV